MMLFYSDKMQKYVPQMFTSHRSEFSRLFRLRPGTTWMKSLQEKPLDPQEIGRMTQQEGSFLSQPGLNVTPEWAPGS